MVAGLNKLEPDARRMEDDLASNWEVLGEAIQTVMRRYGQGDAYERLKALTRGEKITPSKLREFIDDLELPEDAKQRLRQLEPASYIGLAATLARQIVNKT